MNRTEAQTMDATEIEQELNGDTGLNRLEQHTIDSDHVVGVITNVDTESAKVDVVKMTTGETFTENMTSPQTWSDDYKFVRLVREFDYSAERAAELEGEEVVVDVSSRSAEIELEDENQVAYGDLIGVPSILFFGATIAGFFYTAFGASLTDAVGLLLLGFMVLLIGINAALCINDWLDLDEDGAIIHVAD